MASATGPVLLGYDGSDCAKAAIAGAGPVLAERRAVVASVWLSIASSAAASMIAIPSDVAGHAAEQLDHEVEANARRLADEGAALAREAGFDAEPRAVRCASGNVWSTLVQLADDERAAVVVVGSRGLSGVRSALLGSVSRGVVGHCSRPVLVIRESA